MNLQQALDEYKSLISQQEAILATLKSASARLTQRTYIYKLQREEADIMDFMEKENIKNAC